MECLKRVFDIDFEGVREPRQVLSGSVSLIRGDMPLSRALGCMPVNFGSSDETDEFMEVNQ